jgi:hypothetical protein
MVTGLQRGVKLRQKRLFLRKTVGLPGLPSGAVIDRNDSLKVYQER